MLQGWLWWNKENMETSIGQCGVSGCRNFCRPVKLTSMTSVLFVCFVFKCRTATTNFRARLLEKHLFTGDADDGSILSRLGK
jgi:hypothetical protein